MGIHVPIEWQVGWSDHSQKTPERWVPAQVPGAVQLDWAKNERWDDHNYGDNWKQYAWMEDKYWTYRAILKADSLYSGACLYLICKGIDYSFQIRVNGEELWRQEGMFTPVEIDLTDIYVDGAVLEIVIDPVPKRIGAAHGREEADHSCKPAVSYGWDWHPRLIPLGIWDEAYLDIRANTHVVAAETIYELNESLEKAVLSMKAYLNKPNRGEVIWRLINPSGHLVFEQVAEADSNDIQLSACIDHPQLWWPHDQGEQPLYTSEIYYRVGTDPVINSQCHVQRIGFRRARLVMHEGAWQEPYDFPKSRSNPPITMEINGRRIFCKGTNWVQPNIFPGQIRGNDYRILLQLAKSAHMNMLRSWGGCIVNKAAFFELCDEMGMMVWQEFPLACNLYPDTAPYLKILDQESRSIITRLRKHASVILWCGGNELFNSWSGMTDQSYALRLLNANCYELNPQTPYIMTSPLEGMAHGNYVFRYESGEDIFQVMPRVSNTAYTEFGIPSPSSVEQLKSFIPPEELFPPRPGTIWESHHAFHAWTENTWLMPELIEDYFGKFETLEQLVDNGQLLQAEGYKCIYEEARRQKPKCSMVLNWCYNEVWPTAANNSLLNWPAAPKPAYWAVQSSCRPILASARIPKFTWTAGEWFQPEMWLLNDSPTNFPSGVVKAYLVFGEEERFMLSWEYPELHANANQPGPTIRYLLPINKSGVMKLVLKVTDFPEWDSEYSLLYTRSEDEEAHQVRMLNM